jgi:hypothetical protein
VIQAFVKKKGFTLSPFDEIPHKEFLLKNKYGAFSTLPRGDLFFLSALKKEQ